MNAMNKFLYFFKKNCCLYQFLLSHILNSVLYVYQRDKIVFWTVFIVNSFLYISSFIKIKWSE